MKQRLWQALIGMVLALVLVSCQADGDTTPPLSPKNGIAVVPTPAAIAQLNIDAERYSPQVSITSPAPNSVSPSTSVTARFEVKGYPLFKDPDLGLGPHLHVILDDEPYRAHYDATAPLTFSNLKPGTHTLRAFASRPWHESYKNSSAYAQVTFHVLAPTSDHAPQPQLPLLAYSRPEGTYGAEPIMLDFWLANAPIHESIVPGVPKDWQVRYSLNGITNTTNRWEPLYLKGFKPGENVFTAELVDGKGEPIRNVFNSGARIITYNPGGSDTLSRLVRGDLSAADALSLLGDLPEPTPQPSAKPTLAPTPEPSPEPTPTASPTPEPTQAEPSPTPEPSPEPTLAPTPEPTPEPSPEPTPTPKPTRRPTPTPTPESTPTPKPTLRPTPAPTPKTTPTPEPSSEPSPEPTLAPTPASTIAPTPTPSASPEATPEPRRPFFNFRVKTTAIPESLSAPSEPASEPTPVATPEPEPTAEPEATPEPTLEPLPSPSPTPKPTPLRRRQPVGQITPLPTPAPTPRAITATPAPLLPTPLPRITPIPFGARGLRLLPQGF